MKFGLPILEKQLEILSKILEKLRPKNNFQAFFCKELNTASIRKWNF